MFFERILLIRIYGCPLERRRGIHFRLIMGCPSLTRGATTGRSCWRGGRGGRWSLGTSSSVTITIGESGPRPLYPAHISGAQGGASQQQRVGEVSGNSDARAFLHPIV